VLPILSVIAIVPIAAVVALWFFGSRTPVDTTITFDAGKMGPDLDIYLAEREAHIDDIRPGLTKQILWADPDSRERTEIAIVYIHGFSASPAEVRPLPDLIAREFGANLFFTRLTGHGTTSEAMATMTVNALVNDFAEAIAIGEKLGKQVVVMATSSGAALSTWGLTQPHFKDRVAAAMFLSPNYGVLAFGSSLLTKPGAREMARMMIGATRSFTPRNDLHGKYWTNSYPVEALLPMAELVKLAVASPVEQARIPALFLISPRDTVVDPAITRTIATRWGGPHRLIEISNAEDPSQHVLAGDAMSPSTTEPLAQIGIAWLRETLAIAP
jgi:alpha-beta hydrolase superfamily lysophospholipase